MRSNVDWERIERDYRAGSLSIREIAKLSGISEAAVRQRAKAHGWERDLSERVAAAAKAKLLRTELRTRSPEEKARSERESIDEASNNQVAVQIGMRTDILRTERVFAALIESLERAVQAGVEGKELSQQISNLESLSRTQKTLIGLKRQAWSIRDDGDGTTDTYEDRLHRICEGVPA